MLLIILVIFDLVYILRSVYDEYIFDLVYNFYNTSFLSTIVTIVVQPLFDIIPTGLILLFHARNFSPKSS